MFAALFHPYNGLVQYNGLGTPPYQIDLFCASLSVIILSAIPNGVHLSFRLGTRPFLHQKQLRSHYTTYVCMYVCMLMFLRNCMQPDQPK